MALAPRAATGCECAYFEVDSDLVVAEKQRLIRNHPILIEAVGPHAAPPCRAPTTTAAPHDSLAAICGI